jgi:hypothetical protein
VPERHTELLEIDLLKLWPDLMLQHVASGRSPEAVITGVATSAAFFGMARSAVRADFSSLKIARRHER